MSAKSLISERKKLIFYIHRNSWSDESVTKVGLMFQNEAIQNLEELARNILETIEGMEESKALKVLETFPQYPDDRQLKAYGIE